MKKVKAILQTLNGAVPHRTPIWFMRQAGRYLPEYKQIRLQTKDFMSAVLTPEIATEITLQPIRRFDIDAAIVFSDILVLPYAMGVNVEFHEGIGPILEYDIQTSLSFKEKSEKFHDVISKVCKTISLVKENLAVNFPHVATIGFAGAPWTVACYMLEKNRKGDFEYARKIAYQESKAFENLIQTLTQATITFLLAQIEAGAEVIKIFDSHAGLLGESQFMEFVIKPMQKIVSTIRSLHPHIPIIGFPRRAGVLCEDFVHQTNVNAIAIDHTLPLSWARNSLQSKTCVQGNLDNICLTLDLEDARNAIESSVDSILINLQKDSPERFIFNLGHGCLPTTRIENIECVIQKVRNLSCT